MLSNLFISFLSYNLSFILGNYILALIIGIDAGSMLCKFFRIVMKEISNTSYTLLTYIEDRCVFQPKSK